MQKRLLSDGMNLRKVIQGHDGPMEVDETKGTVTKTYVNCAHAIAVRKVEREVAYASRFFDALSRVPGLSCSRILAWNLSSPPRVVMKLCTGDVLSSFLKRIGKEDARIAEIATKIHDGLDIYTRLFEEPYYDLSFQNMLYEETSGTLTFLDFDVPEGADEKNLGSALDRSLGNLVGWSCYEMARPAHLLSPKLGYLEALRAVLASFDGEISVRRVCALAHVTFSRLTQAGTSVRRHYYKTAGRLFAGLYLNRLKLDPISSDLEGAPGERDEDHGGAR